ncbi:phosphotransferase family protein [Aspergillus ibericus CBS 121593]|uniref:Altered inheritance of mitochondria protein 9, mitochondrial n=1 Tax=Aspergillus ibericus CBS 121593 TaxID=1448316 RepID=A0A395HH66_9EURO|nr:phosphotransferase family protein [Aspergillus ibericus CBS 121593]RAL05584.1 phosphotransferase family protein [Aspergillus ibericus CBS 121593]
MAKIMDQGELFRYTSGRWLINEEHQLEQRFVKFDMESLCRQAVSLFSKATKCVCIVKLEGNFNKAFLLTMDDGNEVIAKIPCPNAGTPSLTTASEVATLRYLRSCTSVRVPEVFAWSSDPGNPVGAEYIIMEKVPGIALSERWEAMNMLQRYKIIDRIIEVEKELEELKFPAYGSLYLRQSVPDGYCHYPLPPQLDPTGLFCVGPSCNRSMWSKDVTGMCKSMPNVGPWASFLEFALSIPERELDIMTDSTSEVQHHLNQFDESQSLDEYFNLLQKVKAIIPTISHHPLVREVADPVLWHTDLHLGNIFVSMDDPTIIEGIIDWQSTQIAPLFLQARFPEFLRPPKDYNPGTDIPNLPSNFDELDPEQKDQARRERASASQSKYYEMSNLAYNKRVYDAMKLDRRLWEPFTCCQLFSNGSMVPLRNSLLRVSQDWDFLDLPGSCPFQFSEEELKMHNEKVVLYQDMLYLWDVVKTQLCTDDSGWVPMERWEKTNDMNKSLFETYIKTMSEELSLDAASKKWPFPPKSS